MGGELEVWDGGRSVGWGEQFPLVNDWGEVDALDAASLSALALGKLPELLLRRRHIQPELLGCSVPRGILFLLCDLFID